MTSHAIALVMLGIAIGGSAATTVLCLCAAARCQDCRFRFGPEWPDEDLPSDGAQPSVYTPPSRPQPEPPSSPAPDAFHDRHGPQVLGEQVDGPTQASGGRESRAGLGGLSPAGAVCIDCGRLTSMTLSGLCAECGGRRKA